MIAILPAAHLNEQLKRLVPVVSKLTNPQRLQSLLCSPYLTFEDTTNAQIKKADARAMGVIDDAGYLRTPFSVFRFCIRDSKGRVVFGCVQRNEGELILVALQKCAEGIGKLAWTVKYTIDHSRDDDHIAFDGRVWDVRELRDVTDFVKKTDAARAHLPDLESATPESARRLIPQYAQVVRDSQKAVTFLRSEIAMLEAIADTAGKVEFDLPHSPQQIGIFHALYNSLLILSYEYLAPHNFTARVTPATQGKSVEWLRAREHYTVIHRHHAANSKTVTEGATVTDSKASTRLAHSRRAHTRILRHAKWTYARGKTIFVRATWCGPKEWRDTAGQIYQILMPVDAPRA